MFFPARYILKAQRQNVPSKISPSIPPMDPALEDFLVDPKQCTFEEVTAQKQHLLHGVHSPPYMDTSQSNFSTTSGHMNTQYEKSNMIGSPHSVNGGVQISAMSPGSNHQLSPQAALNSPQNMCEAVQSCIASSQINNFGQDQGLYRDEIKMEQIPIVETVSSPQMSQQMITSSPTQVSQPVQDTGVEIDYLENNFNYYQQFDYGRFQQQSSAHEIRNALHAYDSFNFQSTCSYQARGGGSTEGISLQDLGFDCIDAVKSKQLQGYDEVDSTRMRVPVGVSDLSVSTKPEPDIKDCITVTAKAVEINREEIKFVETENVVVKEDTAVVTVDPRETNFAVKTLRTTNVAGTVILNNSQLFNDPIERSLLKTGGRRRKCW